MKNDKGEIDLEALFCLSYGLYVVTSCCGDKLNGQISNTVFQVSDSPPMVATCVSKNALTHECISKTGAFAVSVLDESTPLKFIGLFGFRSGREVEKLSQISFEPGVTGCPLVMDHAIATLEAKVVAKADVDSHTLFIGEVVAARRLGGGKPLTYAYYREHLRGKTPKNAPTHSIGPKEPEKAPAKEEIAMKKYICDVCGWVYDPAVGDPDGGIEPGTPFEKLPDDWVCPVCGVGKDQFSLVK